MVVELKLSPTDPTTAREVYTATIDSYTKVPQSSENREVCKVCCGYCC